MKRRRSARLKQVHAALEPWVVTAMIALFIMINVADKAVLGLAAVPIMQELQISPGTFGLVASSLHLCYGVSGLAFGVAASRLSPRWALAGLAVAWSVCQLPAVLGASVAALAISRILLGVSEGPGLPQATHALYTWFSERDRAVPSAIAMAGLGAGALAAAPALTWTIQQHGWRSAFVAMAVIGTGWAVVWLAIGSEGPYSARAQPRTPTPAPRATWSDYRSTLRSPTFVGTVLTTFAACWAASLASAYVPSYLATQRGFSSEGAAAAVSMYSLVNVLVMVSVVSASEWVRRRGAGLWVVRGLLPSSVLCLAGGCSWMIGRAEGRVELLVLIAVAFGASQLAYPLAYLTAASICPPHQRGAVLGALSAIYTSAGVLAPATAGWVINRAPSLDQGYTSAFGVTGVVMVGCAVGAALLIRPKHDAHRPDSETRPALSGRGRTARAVQPDSSGSSTIS